MLIPVLLVLAVYIFVAKDAPVEVKAKKLSDYTNLLKQQDAHWFCFYYTVSFGGFVGLGTSLVIYFTSQYGITPVAAEAMRPCAPSPARCCVRSAAPSPIISAASAP